MAKLLHRRHLLRSALAAASGGLALSQRGPTTDLRKSILIDRSKISGAVDWLRTQYNTDR